MSRRQGRYERRKSAREQRKTERSDALGGLEGVFTFHNLYKRGKECCRGSRWKQSTQRHELHLFSGTARRRKMVLSRKVRWKRYNHFTVNERGKIRPIDAPHINDRQIQKVIAQDVLKPLYVDMIYNNGASLKDKGLAFSRRQLEEGLHRHFRLYGMRGSVIVADMSGFFPTADRVVINQRHSYLIRDDGLLWLCNSLINTFPNKEDGTPKGVPLGVEPSQFEMIALPSPLDNFMTCQLGLNDYGHYMDDFVILVPPDVDPKMVLREFIAHAKPLGLTVSLKKTKILSFGEPFRFCKAKYIITETGKIIVHGSRDTIKRGRHKLKSFVSKVGVDMTYEDVWASVNGVLNYYEHYDDHGRLLHFKRFVFSTYGGLKCDGIENFRQKQKEVEDERRLCSA